MPSENPHAVCGAKTRSGTPCQQRPMPNGRCYMHGGPTPVGIALPQFRTGRHSKYMPARLIERYQASLSDPELLNLRDDIALIDARLTALLERVDIGESATLWEQVSDAWDAYQRVRGNGTKTEVEALGLVDWLIRRGTNEYRAWAEVQTAIEQRRKLTDSEQKRLVAMQQMVTAEQALGFVAALQDSVRRHVSDRAILQAIALDMAALVNRPAA